MGNFHQEYLERVHQGSDINEHLSWIYDGACSVTKTVELGIGWGNSTRAFIAALEQTGGEHTSYEIEIKPGVEDLFKRARAANLNANLLVQSTLEVEIPLCDLMLVDSHHTYHQVSNELRLHANRVSSYILFHDTVTFGDVGQDGSRPSINAAIEEFLKNNPEWVEIERRTNNNGMTLLERK